VDRRHVPVGCVEIYHILEKNEEKKVAPFLFNVLASLSSAAEAACTKSQNTHQHGHGGGVGAG